MSRTFLSLLSLFIVSSQVNCQTDVPSVDVNTEVGTDPPVPKPSPSNDSLAAPSDLISGNDLPAFGPSGLHYDCHEMLNEFSSCRHRGATREDCDGCCHITKIDLCYDCVPQESYPQCDNLEKLCKDACKQKYSPPFRYPPGGCATLIDDFDSCNDRFHDQFRCNSCCDRAMRVCCGCSTERGRPECERRRAQCKDSCSTKPCSCSCMSKEWYNNLT